MAKTFVLSTERMNSHGFKVRTIGIQLPADRTCIMLWNHFRATNGHKEDVLPLGRWINLRIEDDRLLGDPEFDMDDAFAAQIAGKVEKEIITECSAGLFPLKWESQGDEFWLMDSIIREASIATVASNEDAVALYDAQENLLDLNTEIVKLTATMNNSKITTTNSMEELKFIALTIGLLENATIDQVKTKLIQLRAMETENETLKLRLQAIEDEKKVQLQNETKTLLDAAVQEQRITAIQRPAYEQLFALSFDSAKTALAAIPKPVSLSAFVAPQGTGAGFTYNGKTFSQLRKESPDVLATLKANDFANFNELYKAEYGSDYK